MTDEALMSRVKNDELDHAAVLYERYKRKLYTFFLYRSNDQARSEDSVQLVFYRVIAYRKTYREENPFRTWLYGIARNIHYGDLKEQGKIRELRENAPVEELYENNGDERQAIREALGMLPEAQRELLVMAKYLGMPYEEIAQAHECSVGVIKTRVFRAMKLLREAYFKIT